MGFWRFFWACVQAAEEKTAGYFGWDLKTMLTALALAVIGYILYLRVHGRHKTKERLGEDLLLTVVPLCGFVVILFVYFFLRAPNSLYNQAQAREKQAQQQSEQLRAELEPQRSPKSGHVRSPENRP